MKRIALIIFVLISVLTVEAQERYILTSDSVSLYTKVKGEGPPCLYIHGGPGSGSYWLEKFFGDFLERHFQMIYLDQRGVGRSTSPKDNNYSMDRMANDFEEVRNALGIKQWITLGHSFGGILQMGYAEQYPESIKGMIMLNCTLNMEESFCNSWIPKAYEFLGEKNNYQCSSDATQIYDNLLNLIGKLYEKKIQWKMLYNSEGNESLINATCAELPNWNNNYSDVALQWKCYWKDFKKCTRNVNVPVLFFYGLTDWSIGPEHFKGVSFPNMILWESNVGHMPFLENKADLENAIKSFIEKYKF